MTRDEMVAGRTDGKLERGVTTRYARGSGTPPTQGALPLPEEVESIHPPVQGREVVSWLVVGEVVSWAVRGVSWRMTVVGVGRRD